MLSISKASAPHNRHCTRLQPGVGPVSRRAKWRIDVLGFLLYAGYRGDMYVRSLISAGAAGYVLKDETPETVVRAIRIVMQGDTWFSQRIMSKLTRWQAAETATQAEGHLSLRDVEILKLIATGWDNARIAEELHLAEQTVRNRVSRVYAKIGASSRAEAIVWARERGLE